MTDFSPPGAVHTRYDDPAEKLIAELRRLVLCVPITHGVGARLRIAVTPFEMEAIRHWCLKNKGEFWARISDVALIVEDDPLSDERRVEYATKTQ